MTGCKGEGSCTDGEGSCTDGEWMQKRHRKGNQGWPEEGKGIELGMHLLHGNKGSVYYRKEERLAICKVHFSQA